VAQRATKPQKPPDCKSRNNNDPFAKSAKFAFSKWVSEYHSVIPECIL
jgi:hypothetical protein